MTSIKLKFRPSLVEGKEGNLYYLVTCERKIRQISTNYRIAQDEWDTVKKEIIIQNNDPSRSNYLQYIQNQIEYDKARFKHVIKNLSVSEKHFNIQTIIDEYQKQMKATTFFSYMESMIARLRMHGQFRTSETYASTLNSFRNFREDTDTNFDDIDTELLLKYEYHLRVKGLSPNTIAFYMKRLRAVYNNAVEAGLTSNRNPFKKVFTSSEKTIKRAIPLNFIKKMKGMDLSFSVSKSFARDMFLFSFYTRGMSFVDIAYLQKKNLKDDILTYRRKKTGQLLSVHWEPCMQKIVNRYSSLTSPYLLSIIRNQTEDTRKQYHNALTLINRNLKEIGKSIGLQLPLTMYVARHSWASIAHREGIPVSVISEGMGHDSERTTQIYLASLDTYIIDKANKKILNLL